MRKIKEKIIELGLLDLDVNFSCYADHCITYQKQIGPTYYEFSLIASDTYYTPMKVSTLIDTNRIKFFALRIFVKDSNGCNEVIYQEACTPLKEQYKNSMK